MLLSGLKSVQLLHMTGRVKSINDFKNGFLDIEVECLL